MVFVLKLAVQRKVRVCCFFKTTIKYMRQTDLELDSHDCNIIDLLNVRQKIRLAGFYRPFKLPESFARVTYLESLLNCLGKAYKPPLFIAGGDINIDMNRSRSDLDVIFN